MSSQLSLTAVSLAVLCVCQGVWAQDAADGTLGTVSVEAPATPFRQLLGVEVTGTAIVKGLIRSGRRARALPYLAGAGLAAGLPNSTFGGAAMAFSSSTVKEGFCS